ncbi:MAG: peptidylprolyl isomerase [Pseudobdellovibrionaceae bacterium]|jgi:FKBP-type peptidyl-prolyl cis-trans isomerase SlyD
MDGQIISFKCKLKNKAGQLISSTYNRDVLTVTDAVEGMGFLGGLNRNLQNLKKGEHRIVHVPAEEAYGLYDPSKVILFPRSKLPKDVRRFQSLQIISKSGVKREYRVLEIHSDLVSLDGNHPLAGQDLIFEIDALDVRKATQKEIDESLNVVGQQLLN